MIPVIEPTRNDFQALASYLVHGKERPTSPDRVAWLFTQNLPTDDPALAATYMAATAERSKRCKQPTYHVSINWHPDERPSPEVMQEIARKTLGLAGLADHQALVMGHGDKPHRHLHMMINRVHPGTGKAWSTSHDYKRFDRIMKLLADEHGFQYVPAHAFNPDITDDLPKQPNSKATFAAKRGAPTNRPQWPNAKARAFGEKLSEDLDQAAGWEDVEAAVEKEGLMLEAKGKGLVVGTPASYAKFSRLGLQTSAKAFVQRFGQSYTEHVATRPRPPTRHVWDVDAIDIARAIGTKEQLRAAIAEVTGRRKARISGMPFMRQIEEELKEVMKETTSLKPPKSRPRTRTSPKKPPRPPRLSR